MKKAIGIIGCGTIGAALAKYAEKDLDREAGSIILYDIDGKMTKRLSAVVKRSEIAVDKNDVIDKADIVIEAVSPEVAPGILKEAISKRKDVLIMSIGGLIGNEALLAEARDKGIKVLLPSGAIAGIDGLKAAKIAGLDSVTLTTRKSPRSLKDAPFVKTNNMDLDKISGEFVVFEGNAEEAIKAFPKNINVSALLSLAGVGAKDTRVRIVTSPSYTSNVHEIEIKGASGNITIAVENVPSPDNPSTSYLAALAAMAALRGYFDTIRIGT